MNDIGSQPAADLGPVLHGGVDISGSTSGVNYKVFGAFTVGKLWLAVAVAGTALALIGWKLDPAKVAAHQSLFWITTFVFGVLCGLAFAGGEIQRVVDEVVARRRELDQMAARKAELEAVVLKQARLSSLTKPKRGS